MALKVSEKIHNPLVYGQGDVVYVGDRKIAPHLTDLFKKHGAPAQVQLDPMFKNKNIEGAKFLRDHYVPNFFGRCLLTDSIYIPYWKEALNALCAKSWHPLWDLRMGLVGRGFYPELVARATRSLRQLKLPYDRINSVIEGGNCFAFYNSKGEKKAIIGEHTLPLTMLGLMEKNYFAIREVNQRALKLKGERPGSDFLRRARNYDLSSKLATLQSEVEQLKAKQNLFEATGDIEGKLADLKREIEEKEKRAEALSSTFINEEVFSPVTKKQEEECTPTALIMEAWDKIAQELIAEELGLKWEDVAFIPPTEFHIDMRLFVDAAHDTVYLHDDGLVAEFLSKIDEKKYAPYIDSAKERAPKFAENIEDTVAMLQKQGLKVVKIAGVFQGERMPNINFMNGIYAEDARGQPVFFTNGTAIGQQDLVAAFTEQMSKYAPHIKMEFVANESLLLEELLSDSAGGLHCITWSAKQ